MFLTVKRTKSGRQCLRCDVCQCECGGGYCVLCRLTSGAMQACPPACDATATNKCEGTPQGAHVTSTSAGGRLELVPARLKISDRSDGTVPGYNLLLLHVTLARRHLRQARG